jgi:hypothetical protein
MDLTGAAWSKPLTIPLVMKSRTLSGSLIPYTSDHGQASSARRSAGISRALKFLLSIVFKVGATLLTLMDAITGKWLVVESVRTATVASRSLVTQTWLRTDSWTLASPSSLLWRPCDRYVTPVVKYLMFASALSCTSRRHLRPYFLSRRLAMSRLTSPAKTILSTLAAAASIWSLTLLRAAYSGESRTTPCISRPPGNDSPN